MSDRNKANPFLKRTLGGWCGAVDSDSRLRDVATFDEAQLRQALKVKCLQVVVRKAIERRLRVLEAAIQHDA